MEPRVISSLFTAVSTPIPTKYSAFSINHSQKALLNLITNGKLLKLFHDLILSSITDKNIATFEERLFFTCDAQVTRMLETIQVYLDTMLHISRQNITPDAKKILLTCLTYSMFTHQLFIWDQATYSLQMTSGS